MTKPLVRVPRQAMLRKPPHGDPCNQCGACCFATTCELGAFLFQTKVGPCPALVPQEEGRYTCGLLTVGDPELRDAAALLIGAGDGCDARFNGEWTNHDFHKACAKADAERADQIAHAKQLWTMT